MFKHLRWTETNGEPVCPACGCLDAYAYACRPLWRCKACHKQFSLTSGTMFHSRKLPVRSHLLAIAIFANGAKGHAALHLSRDLDVQYKTAFVLAHKLREAMGSEVHNPDQPELSGTVHVDGMYTGGHVKPENRKAERVDRRLAEEQTGKRQVVVVAREILGRTLPFIVPRESAAVPMIRKHVACGTVVHADEVARLGCAARLIRHSPRQPFGRVRRRRWRQRKSGRVVLLPAAARRARHPSPDQRPVSLSVRKRDGVAGGSSA